MEPPDIPDTARRAALGYDVRHRITRKRLAHWRALETYLERRDAFLAALEAHPDRGRIPLRRLVDLFPAYRVTLLARRRSRTTLRRLTRASSAFAHRGDAYEIDTWLIWCARTSRHVHRVAPSWALPD